MFTSGSTVFQLQASLFPILMVDNPKPNWVGRPNKPGARCGWFALATAIVVPRQRWYTLGDGYTDRRLVAAREYKIRQRFFG